MIIHLKSSAHLAIVKGVAREEADLGVHPVLDVQKVNPHSKALQALKQAAPIAVVLGQTADDCGRQLPGVPHQHQSRETRPPLALGQRGSGEYMMRLRVYHMF